MSNKQYIEMNELKKKIIKLRNELESFYKEKSKIDFNSNVIRGHVWPISYEFEDKFTNILSEIFKDNDYMFYTDFSLEKRRPDILITKKNQVVALIELKANLGWCRDWNKKDNKRSIKNEINEKLKVLRDNNSSSIIKCTRKLDYLYDIKENIKDIETREKIEKKYGNKKNNNKDFEIEIKIENNKNIKFALISLTSNNISKQKLDKFKQNFENTFENNEGVFISLFEGWYDNLTLKDDQLNLLLNFINSIKNS